MKQKLGHSEEHRKEILAKEKVGLSQDAGLLGFSAASLLAVLGSGVTGPYVAAAFCLFVISTFAYTTVVLSKLFVLHKSERLHIGHVIISEDHSGPPYVLGGLSLVLGLATGSLQFSVWCAPFVVVCACVAFWYHTRFMGAFSRMTLAEEVSASQMSQAQQGAQAHRPEKAGPAA